MRIFIGFALIILFSAKIRADDDDDSATTLIKPKVLQRLNSKKHFHMPATLSDGIPNAGAFQQFFERLSENYMQAYKTLENAQFFVSAVQPSKIVESCNDLIALFDQIYQGQQNRENVKQDLIATNNQLNEYAEEIAEFKLVPFINVTKSAIWIERHRNDFRSVSVSKILADYLKRVNDLIRSIQISIGRSRVKIQHSQLKRLGTKISNGVEKFEYLFDEALDGANDVNLLSSPLADIRNAIDGLRNSNDGKIFNDMKINARKILNDLDQLRLLMEKQWTDMHYILRNPELPQQIPSVNLAN